MISWLLNLLYLTCFVLATPLLLWRKWRRGLAVGGLGPKLLGLTPPIANAGETILIHAVSVGEVLLLKTLIHQFRAEHPECCVVLSVTTATGHAVARHTYPDLPVIWFPFDFTWSTRRVLRLIAPRCILLAELEVWPNFLRAAEQLAIPVVIVNGRLGERSARGYRRLSWLFHATFRRLAAVLVQDEASAARFRTVGVPAERIHITGSLKFDGAARARNTPQTLALAAELGLRGAAAPTDLATGPSTEVLWIAGSTQEPEEKIILDLYQRLQKEWPRLRLMIVPRHQERFNEVARLIKTAGLACVRRSERRPLTEPGEVLLLDTLGELGAAWGLADLAFVGGSFGNRGGQNMLEPAAYGAAVTFGPNTWNFKAIVASLCAAEAARPAATPADLETVLRGWLTDPLARLALGQRAAAFVSRHQGATRRSLAALAPFLPARTPQRQAA